MKILFLCIRKFKIIIIITVLVVIIISIIRFYKYKQNTLLIMSKFKYQQKQKFKCDNNYDNSMLYETIINSYSLEADESLYELRFVRGIVIYYPVEKHESFESEFRWLYLSWIEMQKYEPSKWRTDLIIFLHVETLNSKNNVKEFFEGLDCKTENIRNS
jgi:hypothetical protein